MRSCGCEANQALLLWAGGQSSAYWHLSPCGEGAGGCVWQKQHGGVGGENRDVLRIGLGHPVCSPSVCIITAERFPGVVFTKGS